MGITVYPEGGLTIRIVVERPTYTAERRVDVETMETLSQLGEFTAEDLVYVEGAAKFANYQFRGFPRGEKAGQFAPKRDTRTYRWDAHRPETPAGQAYTQRQIARLFGVHSEDVTLPKKQTPEEYRAELEAYRARVMADLAKEEAAEDESAAG